MTIVCSGGPGAGAKGVRRLAPEPKVLIWSAEDAGILRTNLDIRLGVENQVGDFEDKYLRR